MQNYNANLEEDLIATLLFGLDETGKVVEMDPSLFYFTENKEAFVKIRENSQKELPLDTGLEIKDIARYQGKYIMNAEPAIKELQNLRSRRVLIESLQRSLLGLQGDADHEVIANNLISSISEDVVKQETVAKLSDSLFDVFQKINDIRDGKQKLGLTTGLDFDKHLGGFEDGKLYIVAARPAMGKSAFALEIIKRVASDGIPVGMMSLEMGHTSLSMRLLTSAVSIDAGNIRKGELSEDQMEQIAGACNSLAALPIYFDDNSYVTAKSLRSRASFFKKQHGIGMLVIDYLQLMTGDNDSRERDIAEISRTCKVIAKELSIPVIALAQLNRGVEVRDSKRPRLSDLRESGAIEQDADAVMFLYRPEYYGITHYDERDPMEFQGQSTENVCEVIIGKNRDGETGTTRQLFVPELMKFDNLQRHWSDIEF